MNTALLTYDQWCRRFKKQLKRYIKRKVVHFFEYLAFLLMMAMPIWMLLDWIIRGY